LGVESARAAGIFTIAVNTGILKPEVLSHAGANLVFPGTEALAEEWPGMLQKHQL
jgi:phosphoglycolate phosphatase-like HAD superfamily hydrolase